MKPLRSLICLGAVFCLCAAADGPFDKPEDLTNIGWDEIMSEEALVLVEWPERAGSRLPHDHIPISLQHLPDDPTKRLLYAGGHV